jgi:xanthine dehydrogenase small subunit
MPSERIRFILNGEPVETEVTDPTRTVLQFLREDLRLTGTKEGCAEGDCGACTVVVVEIDQSGDGLNVRTVNACIQLLPTIDGKELITVEGLHGSDGGLHPVQRAMVGQHASQCGFCTPGFVMTLYALYRNNDKPTRRQVDDALAGNLCRCTGYRPIIAAAQKMHEEGDGWDAAEHARQLRAISRDDALEIRHGARRFFAPQDIDSLAELYEARPHATLLAGGTDIGLWITKQHRELNTIIFTGRVRELLERRASATHLVIGAAVSLTDAIPMIVEHYPGLDELFARFASPPIRNAGTLGGNIANGSPIGDSMPALMVLGATLVLRKGVDQRELQLDEFYRAYQVNELQPGEFLAAIRIPLAVEGVIVGSQKWSKRFDQDISAVCTAYRLELDGDIVAGFRMACGGLAETVKRATACEAVINGAAWNETTIDAACAALAEEFKPITDMRASADMRLVATQNLLRRFYLETVAEATQTVYTYGR